MRLMYTELISVHYFFYDLSFIWRDVIFNSCTTAEIAQLGERQTEDLKSGEIARMSSE